MWSDPAVPPPTHRPQLRTRSQGLSKPPDHHNWAKMFWWWSGRVERGSISSQHRHWESDSNNQTSNLQVLKPLTISPLPAVLVNSFELAHLRSLLACFLFCTLDTKFYQCILRVYCNSVPFGKKFKLRLIRTPIRSSGVGKWSKF